MRPSGRAALAVASGLVVSLALAACDDATGSDAAPPLGDPAYEVVYAAFDSSTQAYLQLFVATADGRWRRRLLRDDIEAMSPRWSPDGRRIEFTSYATGRPAIYVADADGSGVERVPAGLALWFHDWSADGARMLVTYSADINTFGFATMRPDGTDIVPIPGAASTSSVSWSPDDRSILHDGWSGLTFSLDMKDADDGESRMLADSAMEGRWSPDGRRIAFIGRSGNSGIVNTGVWVMNADGTGRRRLTFRAAQTPAWSPDGRSILFVVPEPDGFTRDLWVVSADGGTPRRITQTPPNHGPTMPDWRWSR